MRSGAKGLGIAAMFMAAVMTTPPQQANADLVVDGMGFFSGGQSSQALVDAGVHRVETSGDVDISDLILIDSGSFGNGAFDYHLYNATAPFEIDIFGNPLQYGNDNTLIGNFSASNLNLGIQRDNNIYSFNTTFDDAVFTSYVSELDVITASSFEIDGDDFEFTGLMDTDIDTFAQNLINENWLVDGAGVELDFYENGDFKSSGVRLLPGGEFSVNFSSVPESSSMTFLAFAGGAFLLLPRRRREELSFTADSSVDSNYEYTPS